MFEIASANEHLFADKSAVDGVGTWCETTSSNKRFLRGRINV